MPASALAAPGRLGLTRAPGRWSPGRSFDSDVRLREDLATIAQVHGTDMLVTLLERAEVNELGDLRAEARRSGLTWVHFPIPDMWIPADMAATHKLVGRMLRAIERGKNVVVHCWGGVGRAGTIAACCLAAHGIPPAEAIALVRATRDPRAVETAAQVRFVSEFAASCMTDARLS